MEVLWASSGCACACALCCPSRPCPPPPSLRLSLPGSMIERILVSCNNQQDLHEWVDHLQKQTKVTSAGNPTVKPHSVPSHTVRAPVPPPKCRPQVRRARPGPWVSLQTCPHPPWTVIASQGTHL